MKNRDKRSGMGWATLIVIAFFASAFLTRCASLGSPSGGPKDSLPPVIINITPNNYSTNIDTLLKQIYIEFDEFVQLKDQQTNFFTSPAMKKTPQLQIKGRGVVITISDTLKTNTTYALNFGSTIVDYNESNPLHSMRYVFSTGETIDSMILSGYTEDSYKADSVSGTLIMLFPVDSVHMTEQYDSTLFKSTPAVIAKAENNGIFLAQNLKPIPYYIYAVEDTNSNFTYEPGTDQVGFITGARNPMELEDFAVWIDTARKYVVAEPQLHFRMFLDEAFKRQLLSESARPSQHQATLKFGAPYPIIDSLIFDSIPADRVMLEYTTDDHSEVALWFDVEPEVLPDTIRGRIVYFKHDSLNNLTPTGEDLKLAWKYIESKAEAQERERNERAQAKAEERGEQWVAPPVENPFSVKYSSAQEINPESDIIFDFELPLSRFDTTAVTFTRLTADEQSYLERLRESSEKGDSVAKAQLARSYQGKKHPFRFERDTQNIRRWYLRSELGEGSDRYFVNIPTGTFTDVAGFSNDSIAYDFALFKKEDYATIIIEVLEDSEYQSAEYIIELLDSSDKVIETKKGVKPGNVTFNYVKAGGDVSFRMVQDLNKNGKWNSGNLIQRRQSELSKVVTWQDKKEVATKANWEVELVIDPARLFAPESQQDLAKRLEDQERARLNAKYADKMGSNNANNHQHEH
ncbi:MAG: Ig-like domain-containing protein [Rikenellaceae bacterium]